MPVVEFESTKYHHAIVFLPWFLLRLARLFKVILKCALVQRQNDLFALN